MIRRSMTQDQRNIITTADTAVTQAVTEIQHNGISSEDQLRTIIMNAQQAINNIPEGYITTNINNIRDQVTHLTDSVSQLNALLAYYMQNHMSTIFNCSVTQSIQSGIANVREGIASVILTFIQSSSNFVHGVFQIRDLLLNSYTSNQDINTEIGGSKRRKSKKAKKSKRRRTYRRK